MNTQTIEIDMEAIRRRAYFGAALKQYSEARAARLSGRISARSYAIITNMLRRNCPDFAAHMDRITITAQEA